MLVPAVQFSDFVLAIHILAVVVGFGVTFAYPLLLVAARQADPAVLPWMWRTVRRIDRYFVNPGLAVVLLAGIYLAADEHMFGAFFVQWGFLAVIVIGALVGGYMIPREARLAELAARDLAAADAGMGAAPRTQGTSGGATGARASIALSPEYEALERQVAKVGGLLSLIVIVTVFLMATHAGA